MAVAKRAAPPPMGKQPTEEEIQARIMEDIRIHNRTPEEVANDGAKAKDMMSKARKEILFEDPFMGFIICKMQLVWEDSIRTCGVAIRECNVICYYAAPWILTLEIPQVMGVLYHEALHILGHHMSRMASRDPEWWNVACDMAINCLIKWPLPKEGCFAPIEVKNKMAEFIYDWFPRQDQGGEGGEDGDEGGQQGGEGQGPQGQSQGQGNGDSKGKGEGKGKGKPKPSDYGQTMDNHDIWKQSDHAGLATVVVKQMVQEAIARNKGQIPGEYQTMVEQILKTKCDWRGLLRYFISSKVRTNHKLSYKHRDRRRMTVSQYVFPGKVRKEGLDVIVVCDTSGSMMNKKDMEQFYGELEGIITQTQAKTRMIQIDAKVQKDDVYKKGDWNKVKLSGGGGTDFRPVFKYIDEKKYKPCIVVFYTDGYGDFPEAKDYPKYPVIWAMVTDVKAPFGKTIKLDLD